MASDVMVLEPGGESPNQDKSSSNKESHRDSLGPQEWRSGGMCHHRMCCYEQYDSSDHLEVGGGLSKGHRRKSKNKEKAGSRMVVEGKERRRNRTSLIIKRSGL